MAMNCRKAFYNMEFGLMKGRILEAEFGARMRKFPGRVGMVLIASFFVLTFPACPSHQLDPE